MAAIFGQLGVDWRLLLAQGFNFVVVLVVLTIFVWKPLLAVMRARREHIEEGLENAKHVQERLANIEKLKEERMTEAEREAVSRVSQAETEAARRAGEIIKSGEEKSEQILKEGRAILAQRREEQFDELVREASLIVKSAIIKAVSAHPDQIDEKLVHEAVKAIESEARA
jgi:F-type H+-transporting ATPase subunit b